MGLCVENDWGLQPQNHPPPPKSPSDISDSILSMKAGVGCFWRSLCQCCLVCNDVALLAPSPPALFLIVIHLTEYCYTDCVYSNSNKGYKVCSNKVMISAFHILQNNSAQYQHIIFLLQYYKAVLTHKKNESVHLQLYLQTFLLLPQQEDMVTISPLHLYLSSTIMVAHDFLQEKAFPFFSSLESLSRV